MTALSIVSEKEDKQAAEFRSVKSLLKKQIKEASGYLRTSSYLSNLQTIGPEVNRYHPKQNEQEAGVYNILEQYFDKCFNDQQECPTLPVIPESKQVDAK